jgi:hypothetical protein
MTNLACNLIEASRRHPERVALRLDEIEMPHTGLDAGSARFTQVPPKPGTGESILEVTRAH